MHWLVLILNNLLKDHFMKTVVIFLFSILFVISNSFAQNYPFPTSDAQWRQGEIIDSYKDRIDAYIFFAVKEDTLINGQVYHKTYRYAKKTTFNWDEAEYVFAYRVDGDKVWGVNNHSYKEYLFYDFGASVGDTLTTVLYNNESKKFMLADFWVKDITTGNQNRKNILLISANSEQYNSNDDCPYYWIEGVGASTGFLKSPDLYCQNNESKLLCLKEENKTTYTHGFGGCLPAHEPFECTMNSNTSFNICKGQEIELDFSSYGGVGPYTLTLEDSKGDIIEEKRAGIFWFLTIKPTVSTTYLVNFSDAKGTSYDFRVFVEVHDEEWEEDLIILKESFVDSCRGLDSVRLYTPKTYDNYVWRVQGAFVGTTPSVVVSYKAGDSFFIYDLEASNDKGCIAYGELSLLAAPYTDELHNIPNPTIQLEPKRPCLGDSVVASILEPFNTYQWQAGPDTGNGEQFRFKLTQEHLTEGRFYAYVTVTNDAGCEGEGRMGSYDISHEAPAIQQIGNKLHTIGEDFRHYQWYLNNEMIEEGVGPSLPLHETGTYQVGVSTRGYCYTLSEEIVVSETTFVGVDEEPFSQFAIHSYPNPSSDYLYVNPSEAITSPSKISLISLTGQVVYEQTYATISANQSLEIPLHQIPPGLYLLELENDQYRSTQKVVLK